MAGRIDSIAMINLSLVTTDDLQWKYETGSSIASGTGKQKTYSYRNGVETPIGDIEFSVWCAAAEYVIKRDGLQEEQEHLQEFFSRSRSQDKCQSLSPKVLALRFCIHGLYKAPEWVSFVPYSRKYHPEVLKSAHLVSVITECCQIPGDVTEEQIARSYGGTVCCPVCGRWSPYKRI